MSATIRTRRGDRGLAEIRRGSTTIGWVRRFGRADWRFARIGECDQHGPEHDQSAHHGIGVGRPVRLVPASGSSSTNGRGSPGARGHWRDAR